MTMRRMRIACWIIKATNTHSEYLIFIIFPSHNWLQESALMLHRTYSACVVGFVFFNCSTTMFYFPLFLFRLIQLFLCLLFPFFALKCLIFFLSVHFFAVPIMFPREHISLNDLLMMRLGLLTAFREAL